MEVTVHTTPSSRQELRTYLRNRRLSGSVHQATIIQALNDLEEALQLLRGIQNGNNSSDWVNEVEAFLALRCALPAHDSSMMLPGLLDQA